LGAFKTYLVSKGMLSPSREMVFVPAGGVKGIKAVAAILSARDEDLPAVILDGDVPGRQLAKNLREGLYARAQDRLIVVSELLGLQEGETEDLWPSDFFADVASRFLRGQDADFREVIVKDKPVMPQAESYAKLHDIVLEAPGWKVDLAKLLRARLLRDPGSVPPEGKEAKVWLDLFRRIIAFQT
jgi:hypothetical protein